ncbi:MAG: class I SAM-dependent methyltransferase [Acidobacteriota bacterium]|nr:class I SAM-dependent methyltransferase [Acidobacteriota bacterium]
MSSGPRDVPNCSVSPTSEDLFERCHWLYALCREHLFRDHTAEITSGLFPFFPAAGTRVLELGCGPGLYASRLAEEFPQIVAIGIDRSRRLIRRARIRADALKLGNCSFILGDVGALAELPESADAVIVSRLFLIVPDKEAVLAEVFRVLRPGGRCFIAEPTSEFKTSIPLRAMWLLAILTGRAGDSYREPLRAKVMPRDTFFEFVRSLPWASVEVQHDNGYQYAICQKSEVQVAESRWSAA